MARLEWLPAPAARTGQAATRRHSRPGQARPQACRNTTTRSCRRRRRRHRRSCRRRRSVASKMAVRSDAQSPRSYRWPEAAQRAALSKRASGARLVVVSRRLPYAQAPLTMLYDPEEAPADSQHRGQHGGTH
eukprot:scaffold36351_cov65-Phaeocystis_antarctica.AAC.12